MMQSRASADEFRVESLELTRERLRLGAVAVAVLKPLFLPLFYLNSPGTFPVVIKLYAGIELICAVVFYLSYRKLSPYLLTTVLVISTYSLVTLSIFITGGSASPFFPLFLMCIAGIGYIANWSLVYSLVIYSLISGLYFSGILLFDQSINWRLFAINLMSIADATAVGTVGIFLLEKVRRKEFSKRVMAYKEKEIVSRWLHDSLGADLHNISLLCELSQADTIDKAGSGRNLALIADTSRKGLEDIRDFLFSVEKEEASINALLERMRDYGSKTFGSATEFSLAHELPPEALKYTLSPLHTFNTYLICKEALTNIIKHAGATKVEVVISFDRKRLELSIRDNGRGFDTAVMPPGRCGINNLKARANELDGVLDIASLPGRGTQITLEIPLK